MKKKEQLRLAYIKHTGEKPSMNHRKYVNWLEENLMQFVEPNIVNDTTRNMQIISECVAQVLDIPVANLYRGSSKSEFAHPRYLAMVLIGKYVRANVTTIAWHFRRKYPTYFSAIKFVQDNCEVTKGYKELYKKANELVKQRLAATVPAEPGNIQIKAIWNMTK